MPIGHATPIFRSRYEPRRLEGGAGRENSGVRDAALSVRMSAPADVGGLGEKGSEGPLEEKI
jgi:hypothetical protein